MARRKGGRLVLAEKRSSGEIDRRLVRGRDAVMEIAGTFSDWEDVLLETLFFGGFHEPDELRWERLCIAADPSVEWRDEAVAFAAWFAGTLIPTGHLQVWVPPFADTTPTAISPAEAMRTLCSHPRRRRMTKVSRFYEQARRRSSAEVDLGRTWRDEAEPRTRFMVSYLHDTREVVAIHAGPWPLYPVVAAPDTAFAGQFWAAPDMAVEILGVLPADLDVEAVFAEWAHAHTHPDGLEWLREWFEARPETIPAGF